VNGTLAHVLSEIDGLSDEAVRAINGHVEKYWPEVRENAKK
jgi:hypothetical protein